MFQITDSLRGCPMRQLTDDSLSNRFEGSVLLHMFQRLTQTLDVTRRQIVEVASYVW